MAVEHIKLETRLLELTLANFADWEFFPEVTINVDRSKPVKVKAGVGGSIDMVLRKGNIITTIEGKLKMNFDVLDQAYRNRAYAHFSYICVPNPKKFPDFFRRICKDYGIGVLTVSETDHMVREIMRPKFNRKINVLNLEDWMKKSVAGQLHGRMTTFKYAVHEITTRLVRNKGKMNIANVFERSTYHWGSVTAAKEALLRNIRKGFIKEFTFRGQYLVLTDEYLKLNVDQITDPENFSDTKI